MSVIMREESTSPLSTPIKNKEKKLKTDENMIIENENSGNNIYLETLKTISELLKTVKTDTHRVREKIDGDDIRNFIAIFKNS